LLAKGIASFLSLFFLFSSFFIWYFATLRPLYGTVPILFTPVRVFQKDAIRQAGVDYLPFRVKNFPRNLKSSRGNLELKGKFISQLHHSAMSYDRVYDEIVADSDMEEEELNLTDDRSS
jgi:hypothetical protein